MAGVTRGTLSWRVPRAACLAGAGRGVCGAVVIASREQYGSYGWRDRCRGLFQILVAA